MWVEPWSQSPRYQSMTYCRHAHSLRRSKKSQVLNLLRLFLKDSDFCSKDGTETSGTLAKAIGSAKLLPEITKAKNWGPGRGPENMFLYSDGEQEIQKKSRQRAPVPTCPRFSSSQPWIQRLKIIKYFRTTQHSCKQEHSIWTNNKLRICLSALLMEMTTSKAKCLLILRIAQPAHRISGYYWWNPPSYNTSEEY